MSDAMTDLRYDQQEAITMSGMTERLRETTLSKVVSDLFYREQLGIRKYGCRVDQSQDDMLQHAYEEALDMCMYLKTEIERRKNKK